MDSQYERFNKRLEQSINGNIPYREDASDAETSAGQPPEETADADLLGLARQLQATSHLRVDPSFAAQLERRVLRSALTRSLPSHGWSPVRFWRKRWVPTLAASFVLGVILLGAGLLLMFTHTDHLASPFSSPEQTTTRSGTPTISPAYLATADLQTARQSLFALQNAANAAQTGVYVQRLASFDMQLTQATSAISALAAGNEKTLLSTQLTQLQGEARQKLRGWLHLLTPTASAATTSELGRLGESVPQVSSASIILPAHPKGSATVQVTGSGLQQGARLLVDGTLTSATGTLQDGKLVFVLTWTSEKHPHTLGVVNPDGTVAQTSKVTVTTASKDNNGNGQGTGGHQ